MFRISDCAFLDKSSVKVGWRESVGEREMNSGRDPDRGGGGGSGRKTEGVEENV